MEPVQPFFLSSGAAVLLLREVTGVLTETVQAELANFTPHEAERSPVRYRPSRSNHRAVLVDRGKGHGLLVWGGLGTV